MVGEAEVEEVPFRTGKLHGDPVIRGLDMETAWTILSRVPAESNRYTGARSAASASSQDSLRQVGQSPDHRLLWTLRLHELSCKEGLESPSAQAIARDLSLGKDGSHTQAV